MPMAHTSSVQLKFATSNAYDRSQGHFWSHFGTNQEGVVGERTTDTFAFGEEKVVMDEPNASGILTHVLCPFNLAAGEQKVTIVADGKTYIFKDVIGINKALLIGQFDLAVGAVALDVASNQNQSHQSQYQGWRQTTLQNLSIKHPVEAYASDGVGIPFEKSIKVKVQLAQGSVSGAYSRHAGAVYIKKGAEL